ncbi:hypothetical protein CDD83_7094 [Cordyceps sp. RAO-2017]|nr:hypothetical protein CDD83_7094 [Cordyceps sp. RAO-2017]
MGGTTRLVESEKFKRAFVSCGRRHLRTLERARSSAADAPLHPRLSRFRRYRVLAGPVTNRPSRYSPPAIVPGLSGLYTVPPATSDPRHRPPDTRRRRPRPTAPPSPPAVLAVRAVAPGAEQRSSRNPLPPGATSVWSPFPPVLGPCFRRARVTVPSAPSLRNRLRLGPARRARSRTESRRSYLLVDELRPCLF